MENPTRRLNKPDTNDFAVRWGTATIEPNASVKFSFGMQEPIVLKMKQRMVFGRIKGNDLPKADIDLSAYHAAEKGFRAFIPLLRSSAKT